MIHRVSGDEPTHTEIVENSLFCRTWLKTKTTRHGKSRNYLGFTLTTYNVAIINVCIPPEEACENTLLFVCLVFFSTENETNREVAIRQFLQGRCLIFSMWTNQRKVGFLDNPFVSCFQLSMEKWHMSDCVPGSIWQSETWKGEYGQGCNQKRDSLDRVTLKVIFALLTGGGGRLTDNRSPLRSFVSLWLETSCFSPTSDRPTETSHLLSTNEQNHHLRKNRVYGIGNGLNRPNWANAHLNLDLAFISK